MTRNRTKLIVIAGLILIIALITIYLTVLKPVSTNTIVPPVNNPQNNDMLQAQEPAFNKARHSVDEPDSLWVIVNKKRPLSESFVPQNLISVNEINLRDEAAEALKKLVDAAARDQVSLRSISGYRSYDSQQRVYTSYVAKDGQAQADTYSARPGYSEHQTGLAADLGNTDGKCELDECFKTTPGGKWLAQHAHDYGFIIRYEQNKTSVTGYQYEPWHVRYVGQDLAKEIKNTGLTLEEFFGLPAAASY